VENSTEGVVTHTLDMFVDSDLKIVSQIVLPISHCFVSRYPREKIKRIYVHPQTLGQCRNWLQRNFPNVEIVETSSNAKSAELATEPAHSNEETENRVGRGKRYYTHKISFKIVEIGSAAITSQLAAEKYKLPILEQNIQDNAANATRFLVLGRQCSPPTGDDRTSLMVSVSDKVGALHEAIAAFRKFKINMTKIESRPSKRKAWEYFFFIDCDGHVQEKKVAKAIQQLGKHCNFVKILGSYPNTD
jgi:chorismate mutase / prephenate dehydratase